MARIRKTGMIQTAAELQCFYLALRTAPKQGTKLENRRPAAVVVENAPPTRSFFNGRWSRYVSSPQQVGGRPKPSQNIADAL